MAIDYRGRKYRCLMDLLKSYGINYTDYKLKNKIGWSIDEIILGSPKTFRISDDGFVYDHKCNRYESEESMLQSYGLTYGAFHGRLKRGYDLEHALTTPLVRTVSIDDRKVEKLLDDVSGYDLVKALAAYYKKELPSEISMMCRAYGISKEDFQIRIDAGWSLADALCS